MSTEREITAEALKQFVPIDPETTQLTTINSAGAHSYESERELLYKILYELRGNVSDLRRDMNSIRQQLDETSALTSQAAMQTAQLTSITADSHPPFDRVNPNVVPDLDAYEAEEIAELESLNLSDIGKQTLIKALEKNGGNRKKAAQELGISDRTLYRRLKQYGLEKK